MMNFAIQQPAQTLSIAAVERDCGLGKDTLRVWERRYGFPTPARGARGERAYAQSQVERLRVVKRLLDVGHRPGQVVALPLIELQTLLARNTAKEPASARPAQAGGDDLSALLELIRRPDPLALRQELTRLLARHGLRRFTIDVAAPLARAVGDAWMGGRMHVFEEHLFSEVIQSTLRQALTGIPPPADRSSTRVLLGTLPGEPHGLGLLMAEAIFALDGCTCASLGVQTPALDIARAARAMDTHIVALAFAGCLNARQALDSLAELRAELPAAVHLWVGGRPAGVQRRQLAGVQVLDSLAEIPYRLGTISRAN